MSVEITEVPIESGMEEAPNDKEEDKQIHANIENTENTNNNLIYWKKENKQDDELIDDSKKKRGRPKGSLNKPRQDKAKSTIAKAKKKSEVTILDASDTDLVTDTLPAYIQQSPDYAIPQPQDLASQLFGLLQNHERERTNRRRATYASWMTRF